MKLSLLSVLLLLCISAGAQTGSREAVTTKLAGLPQGYATAARLCADPVITHSKTGYAVLTYSFSFIKKGQKDLVGPFSMTGGALKKDGKCLLADLQPGDKVFIDDIKIGCADCAEAITAQPMAFVIQ